MADDDALRGFTAPTRAWFAAAFDAPTPAQAMAWAAAAAGDHVLVSAPTGSGKTLAAFLAAVDRLLAGGPQGPPPGDGPARRRAASASRPVTRVLYVSPLKALAYDVDRNLRAPLVGITRAAERLGRPVRDVRVAIRSGDTPAEERRRLARQPPDILITTPESLFLLLTSRAREILTTVETVIVDEVHAVAGTKRGAHLALSLERLEHLVGAAAGAGDGDAAAGVQRIGLSATQRPLEEVARFLGGGRVDEAGEWRPRPVTIVAPAATKVLDVEIVVPVEDMARPGDANGGGGFASDALAGDGGGGFAPDAAGGGPPAAAPYAETEPAPPFVPSGPAAAGGEEPRRSIWPAIHPRILELIEAHRSTIVFVNSRRLAERLCTRLNDLHAERILAADPDAVPAPLARAHHGSVAREERVGIEEDLKAGRLACVVATSSLELGIDMGAVDLVIQVESPGSVASGLQRIGRAGHHVGAPSVGKVFPKFRGDLLECAVVVRRMHERAIEETRYPRNPLDVLAQQVVAAAALEAWGVDDLHRLVRGAASFADLSRAQLDGVLDMLSGRYPSDEFAELRPRVNWDRVEDVVTGRSGAQRLAVTSGGTIPDRGLYGVFLAADGGGAAGRAPRRVGELDEEMVYETRPGETIVLGSTTWRIADITRDQVLVEPAPGEHGKLPFWHGDALGRPVEVGRAVGAFLRDVGDLAVRDAAAAAARLESEYDLDGLAARNLVAYLAEQHEATGTLPDDTTIVVERFRDEIGDWRIVVHSPFGGRVHAPWALAVEARARERLGLDVQVIYADDGLVLRVPEADTAPPADAVLVDPDEVEDLVVGELGGSALFASRFRECAARALLLPRRVGGAGPGGMRRTPLWQQRQKAADLLAVASRYGSFPVILETYREVLRDVFDVPALADLLQRIESRAVRVVQVETPVASPFASSLLFDYVAGYMYEGDAPLAERRAAALALDRDLLAELVGSDELRELIDPAALADLELELQRLAPDRRARHLDAVHDLLRELGDLRTDEVQARTDGPAADWLGELERARRAMRIRVAGEERWAAAEDAARFRDALGVPPPPGLPERFLDPVERPLVDLVARYARTHGPFEAGDVVARLGLPRDAADLALKELDRERRVTVGEFRPDGSRREWCDAEVLRRLRRRSLATMRKEVEPVEPSALVRFLPAWQGVGGRAAGVERVLEVVEQLQGAPLMASALDHDVLGVRVARYATAWLDELCASGEVVWVGRGGRGGSEGRRGRPPPDQ
jgi:ATP-dependent helicase Lhr and Lhr-like helicase